MIYENKELKLDRLYEFIGHNIMQSYALEAITCSCYSKYHQVNSQDSIALVGDYLLNAIIVSNAYKENNSILIDVLINKCNEFENNETLELIGKKHNIQNMMYCVNSEEAYKKITITIKAIIGAIYFSDGLNATKSFVERIGLISKREIYITDVIDRKIFDEKIEEIQSYGYNSLVLCVVDSVYSIAARYESTLAVVDRLVKYLNIDKKTEYRVSEFIRDFQGFTFEELANNIFKNRQRTSTVSGILKAEAVVKFINVLKQHNIETTKDLLALENKKDLLNDIKKIKGQTRGTTFDYVLMLAGDKGIFKKDRHIDNFFKDYLKIEDLSYENLNLEFHKQLKHAKGTYPKLGIRTLDSIIWTFMSSK